MLATLEKESTMVSELNYDLLEARPVVVRPSQAIELWVIGCGGTGSFLVQLLCRIVQQLMQQDKAVKLVLVDPDTVEPKNLTRQCFCPRRSWTKQSPRSGSPLWYSLGTADPGDRPTL